MNEEPCQSSDFLRFYKEHDLLIREFPTFKHQEELNLASLQSFRTLFSKVTEELEKQLSENIKSNFIEHNKYISDMEIINAINELENIDVYKVSENVEAKF